MSQSSFKKVLRQSQEKKAAPRAVYTDLSVCKALRIRRRVLDKARTASSRGADWDAVGEEVGMTRDWIDRYALENHIVPDFIGTPLEKVQPRNYVSCRLVGTTPNNQIVNVELEANGRREFARVRNVMAFPIHYREIFTCIRIELPTDNHLEWISGPNEMKY